jgi:flagellar hook protein FlgE
MAFQQGLSGLNASSKAIDVISHNIANSSTVGFKASQTHFADVYAASLQGAGASKVGIGVNLSNVFQQFTQGNITTTNNPLDLSINGQGFYRMSQNGAVTYSRNGQFHVDKSGYIVNDQSLRLTGYLADQQGTIVPSTPGDLLIDSSDLAPVATGSSVGALGFTGVRANLNLDSREDLPQTTPFAAPVVPGPDGLAQVNPLSYNFSTALSIYDDLGNPHTMTMYFVKLDPADPAIAADIAALGGTASADIKGAWDLHSTVDNTDPTNIDLGAGFGVPQRLYFDGFGQLATNAAGVPYTPAMAVDINLDGVATDLIAGGINTPNNANTPLDFDLDFTGTTQYGAQFGTNRLEQDGYTSGRLSGISVTEDGVVQGRYSNGQTRGLGQVVLANFTNPNGLQPLGNNQWAETSESGAPLVGAPSSASLGLIQSSSVEDSNVDLTAELVSMITQQRNYQANAQSIKTQDQIMQTLVNLR